MSLLRDLASLAPGEPLAIDCETTGLNPYTGDVLRGISLAFRGKSYYISLTHPDSDNWDRFQAQVLALHLQETPARKVLHNGNFDRTFLERYFGFDVVGDMYSDTQVRAWLLDENRSKSLKDLGERYFGAPAKAEQDHLKALFKRPTQADLYKEIRSANMDKPAQWSKDEAKRLAEQAPRRDWSTVTADEIEAYARKDTELTLAVHARQEQEPEWADVACAEWRHIQVNNVVYRMLRRGVGVDLDKVSAARLEYEAEMREIEQVISASVLRSPAKLRDFLGVEKTDKPTLEPMAPTDQRIRMVLRHRKLAKAISTYLDAFIKHADSEGRIHCWLNTCGTSTGRFSSSSPNMQNIPRGDTDSLIHGCFVAAPGLELVSFDMSKAEVRIAASISDEPFLVDIFEQDRNLYQEVADMIEGDYATGKMTVLSSNYRIGARKLSIQIAARQGRKARWCEYWEWMCEHGEYYCDAGCKNPYTRCHDCDACETDVRLKGYRANVPFLIGCMNNIASYAANRRRLPLHEQGRYRRFPPEWQLRQWGVRPPWPRPYQAFNSAVQGGNAEILKSWLIASEEPLQEIGAHMVLTVHDSLVCEIQPGTVEHVNVVLQETLDSVLPSGWINIPLEHKAGL